jgi:monofunctional glycosyltransferase
MSASATTKPRSRLRVWLKRIFFWLPFWFVLITTLQVLILRWVPPVGSAFMMSRSIEAWFEGDQQFRLYYQWKSSEKISRHLPIALVAAEDQKFPLHYGFDLEAMKKAHASNQRGRKIKGASTITQQLAKNLFLWSGRSYIRKALEAWYTLLMELLWPKERILEVYMNVVEFGDGIYGAEAAARQHFGVSASKLSAAQSARLAAVLPNPKRYNAKKPGPYVSRRARWIERQMRRLGGSSYLTAKTEE